MSDTNGLLLHILAARESETTRIFQLDDHLIDSSNISINALKVVSRLTSSGFHAFLVGGSVRDLLLGKHPKDFDVATDATPEEVRHLFRNARMVGRRFRIVHVRFGNEIVEVATFRAHHDRESHETFHASSGLILNDNVFGSFDEDAQRRDFTINALYYQPEEMAVHDHVGGKADLENKIIRLIGDPEMRYREDPVRMLRAVRFAASLGFSIAPETAAPIARLAFLLQDISPSRLFDEVIKLLLNGNGEKTFQLLRDFRLLEYLFPATALALADARSETLVLAALRSTDQRIRADQPVTPFFLFAALLWPPLQQQVQRLTEGGMSPLAAIHEASRQVISGQQPFTSIPRRVSAPMQEVWEFQARLSGRTAKKAAVLAAHKRFRASYDFLLLRERSGESLDDLGEWWTRYQVEDEAGREQMIRSLDPPKRKRRKRRSSRSARSSQ